MNNNYSLITDRFLDCATIKVDIKMLLLNERFVVLPLGLLIRKEIHYIQIRILLPLTSFTFLGINGGKTFFLSKKTKSAFAILAKRLAIMLLVFIATSIDPDLSPMTTTGDSRFTLKREMIRINNN